MLSLTAILVVLAAALTMAIIPNQSVYAQSATNNFTHPSAITQETANIIGQMETECLDAGVNAIECAVLIYESPTTIVLNGNTAVSKIGGDGRTILYEPNIWLWKAVDNLKGRGFTTDSIMLAGEGTEPNPHVYHVIMSK